MGKPTGFLEYIRIARPTEPPAERLGSFDEFHASLSPEQRREQGGRCMNCGVPFCQTEYGCPLHNLIPEWNDEVYAGNTRHALSRLLKTNRFPEFTGRVCPALCENACVCSLHDEPVTVRDNELAIIEEAWEKVWMTPAPPEVRTGKRIAIVGSGPAGLSAAEALNRRGHTVTVYERDDRPGGLLMYGIPNLKLDKRVILRRIEKMTAEGITFLCDQEIGKSISASQLLAEYDAVVLCCGARQARPLGIDTDGIAGVYPAVDYLTAATKSVLDGTDSAISAQGKHVVIVGNGDTATDCVATALRQGAKSVTQLVRRPRPENSLKVWPYPSSGEKVDYGQEEAIGRFGTDPRLYGTVITRLLPDEEGALRAVEIKAGEEVREIPADLLLTATGFSGAEVGLAKAFGLTLNERGRLGGEDYRTAEPKVFACGDLRRGASLVVWAIAEGRECAKAVDAALEGYTNL